MDLWRIAVLVGAIIISWLVTASVTLRIAHKRGGKLLHWTVLGLLLGPAGIYLVLRQVQICPHCQAKALRGVYSCPQCRQELPRLNPDDNPAGPLWTYRKDW